MWRYLAGGMAALLMAAAGMALFGHGRDGSGLAARPLAQTAPPAAGTAPDAPLPDSVPAASDRTREQKRFDRYDKDRDGGVARAEYLAPRQKAFAKLDANHDGVLSFDEWAAKTEAKFTAADADRNGTLTRPEFATTAVKHKAGPRHGPCAPADRAAVATPPREDDEGS